MIGSIRRNGKNAACGSRVGTGQTRWSRISRGELIVGRERPEKQVKTGQTGWSWVKINKPKATEGMRRIV